MPHEKIRLFDTLRRICNCVLLFFLGQHSNWSIVKPLTRMALLSWSFLLLSCSSCPPADRLMAQLSKEYADKPVLFVEMHVDYWDRLGWKDTYSQHIFTERQNEYSNLRNSQAVYTPQTIVNGFHEVTGSTQSKIVNAIDKGLAERSSATISVESTTEAGSFKLHYKTTGNPRNSRVVLLLVQHNATIKVGKGENGGRTLDHVNIVRSMSYKKAGSGSASLDFPQGLNEKDLFVAAYLQDTDNGHIVAMARP